MKLEALEHYKEDMVMSKLDRNERRLMFRKAFNDVNALLKETYGRVKYTDCNLGEKEVVKHERK